LPVRPPGARGTVGAMLRRAILTLATIAAVALTVVVGAAVYRLYESRAAASEVTPALNNDGTPASETAGTLINAYAMNEIAADQRYKRHSFTLKGVVAVGKRGQKAEPVGGLYGVSTELGRDQVILRFRNEDDAAKL